LEEESEARETSAGRWCWRASTAGLLGRVLGSSSRRPREFGLGLVLKAKESLAGEAESEAEAEADEGAGSAGGREVIIINWEPGSLLRAALALNKRVATSVRKTLS
jgi:hypothetical protein